MAIWLLGVRGAERVYEDRACDLLQQQRADGDVQHIFLHREQFGNSFAYDEDKNLISVANLAEKKSSMEYDDYDNLLSYVRPGAEAADKYVMTYGDTEAERKSIWCALPPRPWG